MSWRNPLRAWRSMLLLVLAGCTSGNIVSDFREPRYLVIDRIGDDVEIRRYGAIAELGDELVEIQVTSEVDLATTAYSGLVAARTIADEDPEAVAREIRAELEQSPKWAEFGDPAVLPERTVLGLVGVERRALAVPIKRRADLFR